MAAWQRLTDFLSKHALWILLILGLVNGSIFIAIVPPWMHYDEPGNFEYAWLIANQEGWPQEGDYDNAMRRELGASMIEHNFPNYPLAQLLRIDEPISIILPQTGDDPLYYFLVSLPLRLIRHTDITFQLYVARSISLFCFLLTIWLAHLTAREIFGRRHPTTWMVPLFLAFLPGLVDSMTAVNNDAAAIAAFSFFTYVSVLLIQKGLSLKRGLALGLAIILCMASKSTAWLALPLGALILMLSVVGKKKFLWIAGLGILLLIPLGLVLFSWENRMPALFLPYISDSELVQLKDASAPVGEAVIVQSRRKFVQNLPFADLERLRGRRVTLGAWIWADQPTTIRFPSICTMTEEIEFHPEPVEIGVTPEFYAFTTWLDLSPKTTAWIEFPPPGEGKVKVYWDGIVLTAGVFSPSTAPEFSDRQAAGGVWGGREFTNSIRNASGERAWPTFSDFAHKTFVDRYYLNTGRLFGLLDLQIAPRYFLHSTKILYRSFWGMFGWGEVYLLGHKPYRGLFSLMLVFLVGALIGVFRNRSGFNPLILILFIIYIIIQYFMIMLRGYGTWFTTPYVPIARYLFPVMVPMGVILIWGYAELANFLRERLINSRLVFGIIYGCSLVGIFIWAVLSILKYVQNL